MTTSEWITDGPNILAPYYFTRIQQAFAAGPVFGRHHHYAGGSSANNWAFRTFKPFWHYVTRSKPGDLYVMWSLPDLLAKDVALLHLTGDTVASIPDNCLAAVKTYLDTRFNEFVALFHSRGRDIIDVQINDIDGYEDLRERIEQHSRRGGESVVFPFTRIETDDYVLLEAKYPDTEGKVPVSGPY
jgi:hypothetical protein